MQIIGQGSRLFHRLMAVHTPAQYLDVLTQRHLATPELNEFLKLLLEQSVNPGIPSQHAGGVLAYANWVLTERKPELMAGTAHLHTWRAMALATELSDPASEMPRIVEMWSFLREREAKLQYIPSDIQNVLTKTQTRFLSLEDATTEVWKHRRSFGQLAFLYAQGNFELPLLLQLDALAAVIASYVRGGGSAEPVERLKAALWVRQYESLQGSHDIDPPPAHKKLLKEAGEKIPASSFGRMLPPTAGALGGQSLNGRGNQKLLTELAEIWKKPRPVFEAVAQG